MLIDICYKAVNGRKNKTHLVYKLVYKICKVLLNLLFPVWYKNRKPMMGKKVSGNEQVVVSFTTFPARIETVWMTAFTLLNQTVRPDHLILWLAESQFASLEELPQNLLRLQEFGLEIVFCKDLRSHKKYYYALEKYPDAVLVTADDDIFYPSDWLEELLDKHKEYPGVICCNWAHRITFSDGRVNAYEKWEKCIADGADRPSHKTVQIGYAGVLYPPGVLDGRVLNENDILHLCLGADDLWLKTMAFLNGTRVICVHNHPTKLFDILSAQREALYKTNVGQDQNNVAISNILDHFDELECFR